MPFFKGHFSSNPNNFGVQKLYLPEQLITESKKNPKEIPKEKYQNPQRKISKPGTTKFIRKIRIMKKIIKKYKKKLTILSEI